MTPNEEAIVSQTGLTRSILKNSNIQLSVVHFEQGTTLFRPGDSCQAFLILCKGSIRVEMTAKSGRNITLYKMQPTESCILTTSALMNGECYYAQGVAESDISAIALSAETFEKAIESSAQFAQYVLKSYTGRMSSIIQLIDRMTARDVMADVSQYLLSKMDKNSLVSVTHTQIANDIGTVREVVGRKLRQLASENIVVLKRGAIEVINLGQLRCRV
jgi:CRP/FNR family transcriptional regulator